MDFGICLLCERARLFRLVGREDKAIRLPSIKKIKELPSVLSRVECRRLFRVPKLLKHRILLSLIYSSGLRCAEARSLELRDIDFDRMQIHIRQGKGKKDRYVPLAKNMVVAIGIVQSVNRQSEKNG
jgi:integrase/recombinase XerD